MTFENFSLAPSPSLITFQPIALFLPAESLWNKGLLHIAQLWLINELCDDGAKQILSGVHHLGNRLLWLGTDVPVRPQAQFLCNLWNVWAHPYASGSAGAQQVLRGS